MVVGMRNCKMSASTMLGGSVSKVFIYANCASRLSTASFWNAGSVHFELVSDVDGTGVEGVDK